MIACEHYDDLIALEHFAMRVAYCRECSRWAVRFYDPMTPFGSCWTQHTGEGLEDYRLLIEAYARNHPHWDATYLYGLGGSVEGVEAGE